MPSPPMRLTWAEARRKSAHMAAFWPALLLPWMSPAQAMGVAFLLLLMNVFILPRAARGLYRTQETGMGALEIVLYPAALMACVAAFGAAPGLDGALAAGGGPGKPAWYLPVGAAWFALAFVDACIGLACRLLPRGPALPWNPRKPAAAVLLGTAASLIPAYALVRLVFPPPSLSPGAWAALAALVAVAACAETAWFGVADNIVIPFALCVLIPLIPNPLVPSALPTLSALPALPAWGWAAAAVLFGVASFAGRLLTLGGAILGAILSLILILADPRLFLFMGAFFVLGNLATRFGMARKRNRGLAEARGGRRGAAEVFGAMGMAAWMTPLVHSVNWAEATGTAGAAFAGGHGRTAALLVCVAPLIAKTMDTVSSETGKALGGRTLSLRTLRAVPPGTEGGVSLGGTLWGLGAASLMAAAVVPMGWGSLADAAFLTAIALLANVFESYWGEYARQREMDQGPHTNILMTLAAAISAWLLWFVL